MLTDAQALAGRDLIDGARLTQLKGPVGFRNLVSDLILLASLLRESLPKSAGKTAITPEELDQAETFAGRISTIWLVCATRARRGGGLGRYPAAGLFALRIGL